jgi:hypothetical protein
VKKRSVTPQITIKLRERDFNFFPALERAADRTDRSTTHLARQCIIRGLFAIDAFSDKSTPTGSETTDAVNYLSGK